MRALVAALVLIVSSQQPAPQQPVFRGTTDLVRVDAVVTDKDGRLVHGLTKDDFEIYDNGKPQPIAAFGEVTYPRRVLDRAIAPPHVDVATNTGPTTERLVVVFLDDEATRTYHGDRVEEAIGRFLHDLGGDVQLSLIRASGRPGIEFTTDPQIVLNALDIFEGNLMAMDGRGANQLGVDRGSGASAGGRSGGSAGPGSANSLQMIEDALQYLSPNDSRRKTILFVSESVRRVDPEDAAAMVDPATSEAQRLRVQKQWLESLPRDDSFRRVVEIARRVNAAIYSIDPRGLAKPGQEGFAGGEGFTADMPFRRNDVALRNQSGFITLAAQTGGYAVVNTDDFAAGVDHIVDEMDNYYVLGFAPPDPKATKPHNIEVRVKREGAEPRYRREYVLNTGETKADKAAKKDALLGLALSPVATGDLPLKLWGAVIPPQDAASTAGRLALWLQSDTDPIADYAIYVMDMKRGKEIKPPTGRTLTGIPPVRIPLDTPTLPPGRYQLRVAARGRDTGKGGSVYLTIDVPDFAAMPLAIAGIVLGSGDASRRDLGPLSFTPTLDREFDAGATVHVAFDVWRRPAVDAQVAVELLDSTGAVVRRMADAMPATSKGHVDAPLAFRGLAGGDYILRITATANGQRVEQTLGLSIR